uniref:Transmembrane protein 254 n=1 Tax=Xenopus tropicalis TaxID=8364 RepID=A0A803KG16_XENTR
MVQQGEGGDKLQTQLITRRSSKCTVQKVQWTVFWPATVPYKILGPLGSFAAYMVKNHPTLLYYGFWGAWIVHLLEAVYSAWLCRSKGITETSVQALWVVQTFFFGISSLSLLLAYNPGLTKKMR